MRILEKADNKLMLVPVASGQELKDEMLIAINESGYAVAATKTTGLTIVGIANAYVDNRNGNDGDVEIMVKRGTFVFGNAGNIKVTDLMKPCFVADNQSVTLLETESSKVGMILQVTEDGVTVDLM